MDLKATAPTTQTPDHISPTIQDVMNSDSPQKTGNPSTDPNIEFYTWLNDHDYKVKIEALTEDVPFLAEKGFIMTDKPLLVVKVVKKEANK